MSTSLHDDLLERAASYATAWEGAHHPSDDVLELRSRVARRRRLRGGALAVGAAACLGVVVAVVYAATDAAPTVPASTSGAAMLEPLANLGEGDAVVVIRDQQPADIAGFGPRSVVIVSAEGDVVERFSDALVRDALGTVAQDWPTIELVAVDAATDRAVFRVSHPTAYVTPHVAILDLRTGATLVVDPCESTLESIDVSQWCYDPPAGPAVLVDPLTSASVTLDQYNDCATAGARYGDAVVAVCGANSTDRYLVTWNPQTGATSETPLGIVDIAAPWVVGGKVFLNESTVEGGAILADAGGVTVEIGGGAAGGVAQIGDRILVYTSSDAFGAKSSYGNVLGLWSPATDEFTQLPGGKLQPGTTAVAVEILR